MLTVRLSEDVSCEPHELSQSHISFTEYTFCQERDLFNGVRCCTGTDGDPDELNVCAEGNANTSETDIFSGASQLKDHRIGT